MVPAIVDDVNILPGRRQRLMPKVVAHESQIHLPANHVAPCAVTQPVRRCLLEIVRALRVLFTARC
jgi:hypothetical protein